jgi:hypothetical protein
MNRSQLRITTCHDGGDSSGSHRIGKVQSMVSRELVTGEQAGMEHMRTRAVLLRTDHSSHS